MNIYILKKGKEIYIYIYKVKFFVIKSLRSCAKISRPAWEEGEWNDQ